MEPPAPAAPGRWLVALILALVAVLGLIASPAGGSDPATAAAAPVGRLVQPKGEDGLHPPEGHESLRAGAGGDEPTRTSWSARTGGTCTWRRTAATRIAAFGARRRTGLLEQLPGRRGCVRHGGGRSCGAPRAGARRPGCDRDQPGRRATSTWRPRAATRSASSRATGAPARSAQLAGERGLRQPARRAAAASWAAR